MSRPPGVEPTLQLLERLQSEVRALAAREQALAAAARQRSVTQKARTHAALAAEQTRRDAALEEARQTRTRAAEQAAERARTRAARIREAHRRVRKAALEAVNATEGRRKFDLQREMLKAAREREAGLAAADAAHAALQSRLAEFQHSLAHLERDAHAALGAYGARFLGPLARAHEVAEADLSRPAETLIQDLDRTLETTHAQVRAFAQRPLTRLSRLWALWLVILLCPIPMLPVVHFLGFTAYTFAHALSLTLALLAAGLVVHFIGKHLANPAARHILNGVGQARLLHHGAVHQSAEHHQRQRQAVETAYAEVARQGNEAWSETEGAVAQDRETRPRRVDERAARIHARLDARLQATLELLDHALTRQLDRVTRESDARLESLALEARQADDAIARDAQAETERFEADWNREIGRILDAIRSATEPSATPDAAASLGLEPKAFWETWTPPAAFAQAVRFGRLTADTRLLAGEFPASPRLIPVPPKIAVPLHLVYPEEGSLVLETRPQGRDEAIAALNQTVLRLLAGSPPGRVAFTIIDPVGLGQSFAGLMHLADEADHLIQGRIWTQSTQIEERLGDLNDHLEKVIQMYLRNEYATIADYNAQAGNIAEKYHFLVVADFPAHFSDLALRRLLSIAASGARCGVYLLLHWDLQQALPPDFPAADLRKGAVRWHRPGQIPVLNGRTLPGVEPALDPATDRETAIAFIQRVARASIDSNRVEVPFEQVAPAPAEVWSLDTTAELRVPIGRTGATKLQYLAIGRGTRQHALIAGKTGSGKSTLFHVIVTNLALWCRPDQVEFYLVDFKKGVEFKCYATHRLPHARVVAIESDREFGLSVLQRVDEELKRRGDLFRTARVQDLAGYRKADGTQPVPRVLLIIDEFQEFFVEEDRIAQNASVLLDRIVRQGRAFGIHVILGSQTLGGAYTVARSTLGQMVIRIALQCNEADAYLIMDDNNAAPRLLSRPGEGIYNDAAGLREGNSPFQAVWLPDGVRDERLRQVRAVADAQGLGLAAPMVFEGDAPGDVRDNAPLRALLAAPPPAPPAACRLWLGAPNAIKGPTEVLFSRRTGDNLLILGQRPDSVAALLVVGVVALAAQCPPGTLRLVLLDASPPGSGARDAIESLPGLIPHPLRLARAPDLDEVLGQAMETLRAADQRRDTPAPGLTFLILHGLQDFKNLRQEDEFSLSPEEGAAHPATRLKTLLAEGPQVGIHVIATCDTYNNLTRVLGRKVLGDFAARVLFQMSANDSANLIDHPQASRLGLHRALLHLDRDGSIEVFRPYALPDRHWITSAMADLRRRAIDESPKTRD